MINQFPTAVQFFIITLFSQFPSLFLSLSLSFFLVDPVFFSTVSFKQWQILIYSIHGNHARVIFPAGKASTVDPRNSNTIRSRRPVQSSSCSNFELNSSIRNDINFKQWKFTRSKTFLNEYFYFCRILQMFL